MKLDPEQMTLHVESCLSKQSGRDNSPGDQPAGNSADNSGSDDDYETYTWCGQTRVRATTMLGRQS